MTSAIDLPLAVTLAEMREPVWTDNRRFLFHSDAYEFVSCLPDNSIDLAFVDPPTDFDPPGNNDHFLRTMLEECWRVARVGVVWVNVHRYSKFGVAGLPSWVPTEDNTDPGDDYRGPRLTQIVSWDRPRSPLNGRRSLTADWLLLFTKTPFVGSDPKDSPPVVQTEPTPSVQQSIPVGLVTHFLGLTGANSVLDPFCGSGTTLVAAVHAGIDAVACDINDTFCDHAAKRLSQLTGAR